MKIGKLSQPRHCNFFLGGGGGQNKSHEQPLPASTAQYTAKCIICQLKQQELVYRVNT